MFVPLPLPVDDVLSELGDGLNRHHSIVLSAPPGSGKTTRVPPYLAVRPWAAERKVLVLEPRRLAARAAARRMADECGEAVGRSVGYRVRFDTKVGPSTRIEVVTEGILTRMIQADPELRGVACIVFDEFHERSLDGDLGLALALESQILNPELRLVVMSATLDTERIAGLLGGAPVITAAGLSFPVDTQWHGDLAIAPGDRRAIAAKVATGVRRALAGGSGSVLAFLPGQREIEETAALLADRESETVRILPLYGSLPNAAQDEAIAPTLPGRRKVVLATNIAETSLTIDGVSQVVDSGLARRVRYDPGIGMGRMETVRISRASADQRRGRAGRTGPGRCLRLWDEATDRGLPPFDPPEIQIADLASLALDLACWGARPDALNWLDPPPAGAFSEAESVLEALGAIDVEGRATDHGRAVAALPLHPRLAHMVISGKDRGAGATAMALATLVEERPIAARNDDIDRDLSAILDPAASGRARAVRKTAETLSKRFHLGPLSAASSTDHSGRAGALLAAGFADRVARRRDGSTDRYLTTAGRGLMLGPESRLSGAEWIVGADLSMRPGGDAVVRRGAVLDAASVETLIARGKRVERRIEIDLAQDRIQAIEIDRLGAIALAERPWRDADDAIFLSALVAAINRDGIASLPWTDGQRRFRQRLAFLHSVQPETWPDVGDAALDADLATWLGPYLTGIRTVGQLRRIDLVSALKHRVGWDRAETVDHLAPERILLPAGRTAAIDYGDPERPTVSAKLQELFGWQTAPAIAGGRASLTVELLSPAGRPLGVSRDLAHFWREVYPQVRKEMRGRYPKHPWPDDPLTAEATALTNKRLAAKS